MTEDSARQAESIAQPGDNNIQLFHVSGFRGENSWINIVVTIQFNFQGKIQLTHFSSLTQLT